MGICPLPLIIFRIKSLLFNSYFVLALFLFFIVALLLCPQLISFFQACTLLTGYTSLILIIHNTFRFKCILYNVNKTENSGGENALIFKKVGAKLKKDFIFYTVLLSFSKSWGSKSPLQTPLFSKFYGCYGTNNWKNKSLILILESIKNQLWSHLKRTSLRISQFSTFPPLCHILTYFLLISTLLCHLIRSEKKGKIRKGRRSFLYKSLPKHVTYVKRNRKCQILQFLKQLMMSSQYIATHILASHVEKVVKLLFFEALNIATSRVQVVFVFIVSLFLILSKPLEIHVKKNRITEI